MKKIAIAAAVAAVALLATTYATPYYTLHQMKTALAERDAAAFSSHVDFPALRESVKQQMNGAMADSVKAVGASNNPFAAMGQAVASAMLGKVIDAMVTPAGVLAMVNQSALGNATRHEAERGEPAQAAPAVGKNRADYSAGYAGWNKFAIRATDGGPDQGGALLLCRRGIWNWQLCAVEVARPEQAER